MTPGVAVSQGTVRRTTSFSYLDGIAVGTHADALAELARPARQRSAEDSSRSPRALRLRRAAASPAAPDKKTTARRPVVFVRVSHGTSRQIGLQDRLLSHSIL